MRDFLAHVERQGRQKKFRLLMQNSISEAGTVIHGHKTEFVETA